MRYSRTVPISEGRDKGKTFVVKEMSAWDAERWGYRLILALGRAGVDVEQFAGQGMAGIAAAGIMAIPALDYRDAAPLLDEMETTFFIQEPGVTRPIVRNPDGEGDDVEEVSTCLELRRAFLELHTRFFEKGTPSKDSTSKETTSPAS